MEYKVSLEFSVEAEDFNNAFIAAKEKLSCMDFISDNIFIDRGSAADELLILMSYVKISTYREKVFTALESAGVNGLMPVQVADESGILQNHVSKVLKELADKDLITCINPEVRKGRIYRLTSLGFDVGGLL